MLALALAVLSTTAFSLVMRQTQRLGLDQLGVMLVNYVVASAVGLGVARYVSGWQPSPSTWQIGLVAGVIYLATYLLIMHSMELRGVAIANAMIRLSVVIPIAAAILVWQERPHPTQLSGAGLALLAMPLLSLDGASGQARLRKRQVALLLGLFLANGAVLLTSKWFQTAGVEHERFLYFGLLYGVSALLALALWLARSRRLCWRALAWGTLLGLVNIVTVAALIGALDALPGAVVFPVFAALGLALTSGFAALAWSEIPGALGGLGIAVAVVAAVLINL